MDIRPTSHTSPIGTSTTTLKVVATDATTEHRLGAEFGFDVADPYAVTVTLAGDAGPVCWTFARDLLLDGRFEPTGDGDVHVWPCLDQDGAAVVIVELRSPDGEILLQFPTRMIREFLDATLAAVPAGTEHADVDAWLERLLAG